MEDISLEEVKKQIQGGEIEIDDPFYSSNLLLLSSGFELCSEVLPKFQRVTTYLPKTGRYSSNSSNRLSRAAESPARQQEGT